MGSCGQIQDHTGGQRWWEEDRREIQRQMLSEGWHSGADDEEGDGYRHKLKYW